METIIVENNLDLFLEYSLGGVIGVASLLLIMLLILRSKARTYVLKNKGAFAGRLMKVESMAANPDVKEETRKEFSKLKGDFSSINQLTTTSRDVDWFEMREKLNSLDSIVSIMQNEIAFAEKAKKECPELMNKIPGMIEAVEKELAKGKQSPKAMMYLEEARSQYTQAQSQQSGMTMTDWVTLYLILSSARSNCAKAKSAHKYTNTYHSSAGDYGGGSV